ncbi:MAG: phosphoglycerate dehydrogenase [Firmicutes bacterium]|nr:phosphoglycerate dehydrogenase [Bacillota bacterium]
MSKKVLITSRSFGKISDEPYEILRNAGYEITNIGRNFDQAEFERIVPEFDALIIGAHEFPVEVMEKCSKLKIICKHGVGLDNIHLEEAKALGIIVTNTPGTNSNAVADLTFGLMISAARLIQRSALNAMKGVKQSVIGVDVCGKTLGLLGFGAVAKCVARRAKGFGMKVLAYDPFVKEVPEEFAAYTSLCGFGEVVSGCDFLSVHLPLTEETRGMIGAEQFAAMKDGSILINTARGGIVDEKALAEALASGKLMAAAMDVVENEPLQADDPLMGIENLILTPHIGMYSKEAVNAVGMICARNCAAVALGTEIEHRVV